MNTQILNSMIQTTKMNLSFFLEEVLTPEELDHYSKEIGTIAFSGLEYMTKTNSTITSMVEHFSGKEEVAKIATLEFERYGTISKTTYLLNANYYQLGLLDIELEPLTSQELEVVVSEKDKLVEAIHSYQLSIAKELDKVNVAA